MNRQPDAVALRRRIDLADQKLAERIWQGADAERLVAERARFFDAFLAELWQHAFEGREDIALLAVGGYGRGELHPQSDIDLLILVRRRGQGAEDIASFVRLLWDLKLDIGHSVRTVGDCKGEAARDITVATALLERRRLSGSEALCAKLDRVMASRRVWSSRAFFAAKRDEQVRRHAQFDDVDYDLEPNIKGAPGGLRDIQTIGWITQRHVGASDLDELTRRGLLTARERDWLAAGKRFLCKVRFGLHVVAGRKEDRLLFDHQRELAERFGYRDTPAQLAVEQFMHDYYRHVLALREVNDILLQHFDEVLPRRARWRPKIEPVNPRFQIHNHYMETTSPDVFKKEPAALMELFVIMANRQDIAGVRAATIRLIRDSLELIDDAFRQDPKVTAYFIDLLRAPYTLVSQLTRMRRYGILGRYIPEFGRIVGQMQHDLFHIYTVDAHTMMVIRNMRRFRYAESRERWPLAWQCVRDLPKIELLYIAGLFHDLGKGRGGDHSALGAEDAAAFCQRHGLIEDDTDLVAWLVRVHLVMSTTAQRKDIFDPDVIHEFAETVYTQTRLDYLYALTVADIMATNPTLWNSWRATLLHQLFTETAKALRHGPEARRQRTDAVATRKEAALAALAEDGMDRERALALWDEPGDEFFLRHSAEQLAAITTAMDKHDLTQGPLALIFDVAGLGGGERVTEIFVHAHDRPHLFAASAVTLDALNLQIHDASIGTTANGLCFNAYVTLDEAGRPFGDDAARCKRVRAALVKQLAAPNPRRAVPRRRVARRLRQFVIPTQATLTTAPGAAVSTLRVVCSDRPGLLARLGLLFVELGIVVLRARITTLGERVEDVFEIGAIAEPTEREHIQETLRVRLDAAIAEYGDAGEGHESAA